MKDKLEKKNLHEIVAIKCECESIFFFLYLSGGISLSSKMEVW